MSSFEGAFVVERQRAMWTGWAKIAARPWTPSLALLALCLVVYLPGVLRLPARRPYGDHLGRDDAGHGCAWRLTDRVMGVSSINIVQSVAFWAQGVARWIAGDGLSRDITVYRIPSLVAVTLAVLALFWLGRGLVGSETALIASALFAVAPLTVLVSQLGIAEGLSLLPATVAMLALARIYANAEEPLPTALLFWAAVASAF